MRIENEKHLVRVANEALMRFFPFKDGIETYSEGDGLITFVMSHADGVRLTKEFLSAMSNGKLGQIVGMKGEWHEYKKYSLLQTIPSASVFDRSKYHSGRSLLVEEALPVVIAAMCDILHTRRILKEKDSLQWQNTAERSQTRVWRTWPKNEMMTFVRNHCYDPQKSTTRSLQTA